MASRPPRGARPIGESIIAIVVTHYDGGSVSTEAHVAGAIVTLGGRVVADLLRGHADELERQGGGRPPRIARPDGS